MIALETEEVMGLKVPPDPNFGKSVDPDQTAGVISFIFGVCVALAALYGLSRQIWNPTPRKLGE